MTQIHPLKKRGLKNLVNIVIVHNSIHCWWFSVCFNSRCISKQGIMETFLLLCYLKLQILSIILFIYEYNHTVLSLSNTFLPKVYQVNKLLQELDLGFMKILHIFYNLMLNRPFDAMFWCITCVFKCSSSKAKIFPMFGHLYEVILLLDRYWQSHGFKQPENELFFTVMSNKTVE